jgi:phospholipid/cholesterol/gamma-HCH transport system substrate-binding protein
VRFVPTPQPPAKRRAPASPRRRRVVGLLVLGLLGVVTYGVFARELPGTGHWSVDAVFSDSGQLRPGAPVRIAGVDVGTVARVGRGPGSTALLTLRVAAKGRPLHADAVATIRPRLFLEGSYYVDLRPGSPSAPELHAGATLPLTQTAVPVSFTSVLSTLTRPVRDSLVDIIGQSASALGDGGAQGFGAGLRPLAPALRRGAVATQALLGEQPDDISRLISGARRVTRALATDAPALAAGITAANRATAAFADEHRALTATVTGLDATLRAAPPALTAVTDGLPAVRRLATDLRPALRHAPRTLRAATALLNQARRLVGVSELPAATARLRPAARQVTALAPRLRSLLPSVQRVARCVGDQGVDLLTAKLVDPPHSTGQPVWQELAHSAVNTTSLAQGFDAAGHTVRFATAVQPGVLALGSVPGVGLALTTPTTPALQIRPQWAGPTPPADHPEVPCATQPLGNLQATATTLPEMRTAPLGAAAGTRFSDITQLLRRSLSATPPKAGR